MNIDNLLSNKQIQFLKDNNLYKNSYFDDDLIDLELTLGDLIGTKYYLDENEQPTKGMLICESILDIIVEL